MFSSMAKNKIKFSEDKKYHKWRRIGVYCLYAAIALAVVCIVLGQVFGMDSKPCLYSGYAAIVLVIWFYLINFFKWRCPNCHKTLPLLGPVLECRVCKHKFVDDKGNQVW